MPKGVLTVYYFQTGYRKIPARVGAVNLTEKPSAIGALY